MNTNEPHFNYGPPYLKELEHARKEVIRLAKIIARLEQENAELKTKYDASTDRELELEERIEHYRAVDKEKIDEAVCEYKQKITDLQKALLSAHNLANARHIDITAVPLAEHEAIKKEATQLKADLVNQYNKNIEQGNRIKTLEAMVKTLSTPVKAKITASQAIMNALRFLAIFPVSVVVYLLAYYLFKIMQNISPGDSGGLGFLISQFVSVVASYGIAAYATVLFSGKIYPQKNIGKITGSILVACFVIALITLLFYTNPLPLWMLILFVLSYIIASGFGILANFWD